MVDQGERVERLLGELEVLAGPVVWPHVEELLEAVRESYRVALVRLVEHAREGARAPAEIDARLGADSIVGALLASHGIAPFCGGPPPAAATEEAATVEVWPPPAMRLEVVAVRDGVLSLRVGGSEDER
jgi:hypothetical protein